MLYLLSAGCQYIPDNNNRAHWSAGEACALNLWPHSEPGASERLLSAWSVLINIPSSQLMINANPIGCASDENPVSQNEVRLGLPRQTSSRCDCTQRSGEVVPQRSIRHKRGPDVVEGDEFWPTFQTDRRFPQLKPEITDGERKSINSSTD